MMSRLEKRVKKLEDVKGHIEVICIPDDLPGDERDAFKQEHLRRKCLPPDTFIIFSRPDDKWL